MAEDEERHSRLQRLKAAVHYTVGGLCQETGQDKGVEFSKHAIAAISEVAFRQCETFAKDLELFARHAKRSTINMEDVKLLSRRSRSLHHHITSCSEEIASTNQEKKRKKSAAVGKGPRRSEGDSVMPDTEDQME